MVEPRHFDLKRDDPDTIAAAALAALDRGELVVLPTETVYGVGAREDHEEARELLMTLKEGRRSPFSLAAASLEMVSARLGPLPDSAGRIARRWWPGPVTMVLPAKDAHTLAVRVPGHPWTRALIQQVGSPLLLPSANRSGHAAPASIASLDPAVLAQVSIVVDGGTAALGQASTVVQPGPTWLRVHREGVISAADLARHAGCTILVVCTGNTCRSPMAGALLRRALAQAAEEDPGFLPPTIETAGLAATTGRPASDLAYDALEGLGAELGQHGTRAVTADQVRSADLVLCMTLGHLRQLRDLAPEATTPIELFDPAGSEIPDPYGGTLHVYRACADHLETMARARATTLHHAGDAP